jgi:predicted aspartyl protease
MGIAAAFWLLTLLGVPTPAAAELWKWTDVENVVRYTNDPAAIPPAQRARAREIGSPRGRPEEPRAETLPNVIPFTAGGPIKAAVHLNGVPLTLILDTGADRTVISPAAAARAGLDVERAGAVQILGVTGSAPAREMAVTRLDVVGTQVGPVTVIVHDVGVAEVDGLLGRDVLDRFTLTVDAVGGQAVLTPR